MEIFAEAGASSRGSGCGCPIGKHLAWCCGWGRWACCHILGLVPEVCILVWRLSGLVGFEKGPRSCVDWREDGVGRIVNFAVHVVFANSILKRENVVPTILEAEIRSEGMQEVERRTKKDQVVLRSCVSCSGSRKSRFFCDIYERRWLEVDTKFGSSVVTS